MSERPPDDEPKDPASRLDSAIERLLVGDEWDELTPDDVDDAEEFDALMQIARALRRESERLSRPSPQPPGGQSPAGDPPLEEETP